MNACATCGKAFAGRAQARYCSPSCRQQAYRQRKTVTPGETVTGNCNAPGETVTNRNAVTEGDDLDVLHDIEARLDQGRIDASDYERADRILQAHEVVVSIANQLTIRLEKMEGRQNGSG